MLRLIRKELGDRVGTPKYRISDGTLSPGRTSTGHPGQIGAEEMDRLGILTHYKNRAGDIASSLAWDDLTSMRLDAGKVIEA